MLNMPSFSRFIPVGVVLLVLALSPATLAGQTKQRIDGATAPTCVGCTIRLVKVGTLGSIDDEHFPGVSAVAGLAVDSRGMFYVTSMDGDRVLVYDRTGKLVRTIGQKGGGPGEFTVAMKLAFGVNDSLYVLDGVRMTLFTPTFEYVRSAPIVFRSIAQFAVLPKGELAFDAGNDGREYAMKVMGVDGEVRPLGQRQLTNPVSCPLCGPRLVARSHTLGRIWSTQGNAYEIEQWSPSGQLLQSVSVTQSSWFTPWPRSGAFDFRARPNSTIRGIAEDKAGRIWISGDGPIANWTPMPPPKVARAPGRSGNNVPPGGVPPNPERLKRLISTIEVLDLSTKRVYASQSFPGRLFRMISAEYFGEAHEDANGIPVWDIYKAEITKP
jgi:hypothetical protein